jgi:Protein of unknown function (DUF3089)
MMPAPRAVLIAIATLALVAGSTLAVAPANAATSSDTSGLASPLAAPVWLCEPGMAANPCNQDAAGNPVGTPGTMQYPNDGGSVSLSATNVVNGVVTGTQPLVGSTSPKVDCFYVYPTVDLTPNPLLQVGSLPPTPQADEMAVMLAQVGMLSSQCRLFVPLYRQSTLPDLLVDGLLDQSDANGPGYGDVEQAWNDYWTHDNIDPATGKRRGVILLGHSQGSTALESLIQNDIDNNPVERAQIVSAVLPGGLVQVPVDGVDGGGSDPDSTFQNIPACEPVPGAVPTGCVLAWSSYDEPAGTAPGSGSFAPNISAGHETLCTNPTAVLNGTDAAGVTPLDTYMPTEALVQGNILNPNGQIAVPLLGYTLPTYTTGFAHYSGRIDGQCAFVATSTGNASWFEITGDTSFLPSASSGGSLGLHVADYNLDLGDLSGLLAAQSTTWLANQN